MFVSFSACGIKRIPTNAVPLEENQLTRINGYYEVEAYHSEFGVTPERLNELLQISIPSNVSYIELEFLSEKQLQVSYQHNGLFEYQIIKGKAKHGGFYLKKRWGGFGIPTLFWFQWNEGSRIFMGDDDNLIFDRFDDRKSSFFGLQGVRSDRVIYFYDRLYPHLYNDPLPPDVTY